MSVSPHRHSQRNDLDKARKRAGARHRPRFHSPVVPRTSRGMLNSHQRIHCAIRLSGGTRDSEQTSSLSLARTRVRDAVLVQSGTDRSRAKPGERPQAVWRFQSRSLGSRNVRVGGAREIRRERQRGRRRAAATTGRRDDVEIEYRDLASERKSVSNTGRARQIERWNPFFKFAVVDRCFLSSQAQISDSATRIRKRCDDVVSGPMGNEISSSNTWVVIGPIREKGYK